MQVKDDVVVTIRRNREIVQPGYIAEKGIVCIDQLTAVVDAKVDGPGIVGPELEGAVLFHMRGDFPDLIYGIIAHLRVTVPATRRSVTNDTPRGAGGSPCIVVQVGRQLIVAAVWYGKTRRQAVCVESAIATVAIVDMVPIRRARVFEVMDTG